MDPSFPEHPEGHGAPASGVRGKRGRKSVSPDPDDGPVARFAHELATLKRAAGDPSYDRMRTEFGAAASKSALSAAARGQTLPSWETTWEFVRSLAVAKLGKDEAVTKTEWQGRWENAATAGLDEQHHVEDEDRDAYSAEGARLDEPSEQDRDNDLRSATDAGPPAPRSLPKRNLAGYGAILVAVVGALVVGLVLLERSSDSAEGGSGAGPYPIPGDDSAFAGDVTIPDGTEVEVGHEVTKTWRIQNTGNVTWNTRFLRAFGDTSHVCSSPDRIPVPDADPGEFVDVSVPVTATRPGFCHVEWKMVDASDRLFFSNQKRPVYYEVHVK